MKNYEMSKNWEIKTRKNEEMQYQKIVKSKKETRRFLQGISFAKISLILANTSLILASMYLLAPPTCPLFP